MSGNLKDKVLWYLTCGVAAIIIVCGIAFMYPNYRRSEGLKRQNAELQARIDRKKQEIAELKDFQRRFKTDADFVEKIARQNHRVLPGELIFLFNKD